MGAARGTPAAERANAQARRRYHEDPAVRQRLNERARVRSKEWTAILQASRVDDVVDAALRTIRERVAALAALAASGATGAAEEKAAA